MIKFFNNKLTFNDIWTSESTIPTFRSTDSIDSNISVDRFDRFQYFGRPIWPILDFGRVDSIESNGSVESTRSKLLNRSNRFDRPRNFDRIDSTFLEFVSIRSIGIFFFQIRSNRLNVFESSVDFFAIDFQTGRSIHDRFDRLPTLFETS